MTFVQHAGIPDDVWVQGQFRRLFMRDLTGTTKECPAVLSGGDNVVVRLSARRASEIGEVVFLRLSVDGRPFPFIAYPGTQLLLANGVSHVADLKKGTLLFGGAKVESVISAVLSASFFRLSGNREAFIKTGPVYSLVAERL